MSAHDGIRDSSGDNGSGAHPDDDRNAAGPGAAAEDAPRTTSPAAVGAGVLPNKAAEDDPRRWGDQQNSYDHDSWLQEQKPPHWG